MQPKVIYRYINNNFKVKDHILTLKYNSQILERLPEIANLLNAKFSQKFTCETVENIPIIEQSYG